jgi:hypothetical protein
VLIREIVELGEEAARVKLAPRPFPPANGNGHGNGGGRKH